MNFDVNKKYTEDGPNAYYKGFVSDTEYYKGYKNAMMDLECVLDSMASDLFKGIGIPAVEKVLIETSERCADYIRETMEYNANETTVFLIDDMPAGEWAKKKNELFGEDADVFK